MSWSMWFELMMHLMLMAMGVVNVLAGSGVAWTAVGGIDSSAPKSSLVSKPGRS